MANLRYHGHLFGLVTPSLIRGVQLGEISRVGWLIGIFKHTVWADDLYISYASCYFLFQKSCLHPRRPDGFRRRHFEVIGFF
jgi:hypothetical protein